jgi:hypothetical protein
VYIVVCCVTTSVALTWQDLTRMSTMELWTFAQVCFWTMGGGHTTPGRLSFSYCVGFSSAAGGIITFNANTDHWCFKVAFTLEVLRDPARGFLVDGVLKVNPMGPNLCATTLILALLHTSSWEGNTAPNINRHAPGRKGCPVLSLCKGLVPL